MDPPIKPIFREACRLYQHSKILLLADYGFGPDKEPDALAIAIRYGHGHGFMEKTCLARRMIKKGWSVKRTLRIIRKECRPYHMFQNESQAFLYTLIFSIAPLFMTMSFGLTEASRILVSVSRLMVGVSINCASVSRLMVGVSRQVAYETLKIMYTFYKALMPLWIIFNRTFASYKTSHASAL